MAPYLRTPSGDIYDADAVDKTVEDLAMQLAKSGEPFATCRRTRALAAGSRQINVVYTIDQGKRLYVERIEIHGNTKTRDEVIRREFDFGEGDAYNRALVDRGERHLKALGYFKAVKIGTRPGSAPDRVVLDVTVEEQQTGDFSIAGGYSTTDGWLAQISVSDRNFLGTGDIAKASVMYGQYARGFDLSFTDPYALGPRVSLGGELFGKQNFANSNQSYDTSLYGAKLLLGTPFSDQLGVTWNYSIYNQGVSLPAGTAASLPIQQAAQAGPSGYPRSATAWSIPRSTMPGIRPRASAPRPTTILPGSAARQNSHAPPRTCATTTRSPATWSAWCGRRAATSRHGWPAVAADQRLLRRAATRARLRAQRFWPARHHAGHDDG